MVGVSAFGTSVTSISNCWISGLQHVKKSEMASATASTHPTSQPLRIKELKAFESGPRLAKHGDPQHTTRKQFVPQLLPIDFSIDSVKKRHSPCMWDTAKALYACSAPQKLP